MASLVFRVWPLSWGLERLMSVLEPQPPRGRTTRRLRGVPLSLTFDAESYLGRFLYYRGMYEDASMRVLRRVLRPGMGFVDIGANIGLHTVIAAYTVGGNGGVVAIEPQEELCGLIRHNVEQNGLRNVAIVNTALGRSPGTAVLHQLYAANPGAATLRLQETERSVSSESVSVRVLPEVLGRGRFPWRPYVMKIDVEGAELDVLLGAAEMIRSDGPQVIFVECSDNNLRRFGAGSEALLECLSELGYRTSALHHGRWIDVDASDGVNQDVIAWRPGALPR